MLAQLTLLKEKDKYGEIAPKAFPAQVAKPVFISIDPRSEYLPAAADRASKRRMKIPGTRSRQSMGMGVIFADNY